MDIKDAKTIRMIKMDTDKYVDLIVSPEGEVINAGWGHVNALRRIMGITEDELCNMVAIEDSPIMWLIEKTGYMTISKKYSFSMAITDKQKEAYDILVHEKIISDNLIDISNERLKASVFYQKKREG